MYFNSWFADFKEPSSWQTVVKASVDAPHAELLGGEEGGQSENNTTHNEILVVINNPTTVTA